MNINQIITPEALGTIVTVCIIPMIGVITNYGVALLKKKTEELEQRVNNATASKYIEKAEDTICTTVIAVSQAIVDTQKKNGTFDQVAAEEAFKTARQQAVTIMGQAALDVLKEVYGDVDQWIATKIEYYVSQNK